MIQVQTLYLIGYVLQFAFALTMVLLTWSDRRARGMNWLAAAGGLQLLASSVRYVLSSHSERASQGVGASLLILVFFWTYLGLRWFVVRRPLYEQWPTAVVSASMALELGFSIMGGLHGEFALAFSRVVTMGIMIATMHMLWHTTYHALRSAARFCAVQVGMVTAVFLFRLIVEVALHGQVHDLLMIAVRVATLISVSGLSFSFISLWVAESKRRLQEETRTDALTGLCNRRAMEEFVADEIRLAEQNKTPLALLMLDLDKFKVLNDTWGHWTGDRALKALGATVLATVGQKDIIARVGGEEFAVMLPGRDLSAAEMLAEQLRRAVEKICIEEGDFTIRMTVSIGISMRKPGERTWADMLRRADKALYQAKRSGRNRVVVYNDRSAAGDGMHAARRSSAKDLLTGTGTGGRAWQRDSLKSS